MNIGLQYIRNTSEYILKLQLHQHSLLTRKVFARHNLSAQVFFSVSFWLSSGLRHIQVIFIFKSSSSSSHRQSSNLDHLLIWIIMGHHHWIWIITRSRSSLVIITRSGSSSLDLNLDHHWPSSSRVLSHDSSRHSNFYRANLFSC